MKGLETDEIQQGLWLGSMGDAAYLPFREYAKISHIVNMSAEAQPPVNPEGVEIMCLAWRDSENQGKSEIKNGFKNLMKATKFINDAITSGGCVMVHCTQGVSRSAATVVSYLMQYKGMDIVDAIALVKQKHPVALKPNRFQNMLTEFNFYMKTQEYKDLMN